MIEITTFSTHAYIGNLDTTGLAEIVQGYHDSNTTKHLMHKSRSKCKCNDALTLHTTAPVWHRYMLCSTNARKRANHLASAVIENCRHCLSRMKGTLRILNQKIMHADGLETSVWAPLLGKTGLRGKCVSLHVEMQMNIPVLNTPNAHWAKSRTLITKIANLFTGHSGADDKTSVIKTLMMWNKIPLNEKLRTWQNAMRSTQAHMCNTGHLKAPTKTDHCHA